MQKCARVLKNSDNARIMSILTNQEVDLILLEVLEGNDSELVLISSLTHQFPELPIVVIDGNGDRHKLAQAFNCGAKDAFRRPYKCDLIIERVNALLRHLQC